MSVVKFLFNLIIDINSIDDVKDVDDIDEEGYRAQISWYPVDGLTVNLVSYSVDSEIGGPGIAFHCYKDDRPADSNVNPSDRAASVPNFPVVGGCETGPNGAYDGETARFKRGPDHVYVTHMAAPGFKDGGKSTSEIMKNTEFMMSSSAAFAAGAPVGWRVACSKAV